MTTLLMCAGTLIFKTLWSWTRIKKPTVQQSSTKITLKTVRCRRFREMASRWMLITSGQTKKRSFKFNNHFRSKPMQKQRTYTNKFRILVSRRMKSYSKMELFSFPSQLRLHYLVRTSSTPRRCWYPKSLKARQHTQPTHNRTSAADSGQRTTPQSTRWTKKNWWTYSSSWHSNRTWLLCRRTWTLKLGWAME